MKQKLLMALALILTLLVVFTVSVQSQTIFPLRLGELPRMVVFDTHKMGEVSCPSDHVLVFQVISSYRAWVSCPPSYFIAPIADTPVPTAPVSPLATPTTVLPTSTTVPPTATATKTPVLVPTVTNTPVPGATATATRTNTPVPLPTATATKTPLPVATATSVPVATATSVPIATATSIATAVGSIQLDPNTTYQTFESWEATDFNGNVGLPEVGIFGFNPPVMGLYKDVLAGLAVNELGINRVRLAIMSGAENPADSYSPYVNGLTPRSSWEADRQKPINDNTDPNVIDFSGFQFSLLDHRVDTVVLPLKQQLAAKGETLYVNLNYVDFDTSPFEHKANPQEYAEFILATFLHLQQKYGWVPNAVEVILEPDNGQWSSAEVGNALVATAQRLEANGFNPDFIAPSYSSLGLAFFDQMVQNVPAVLTYLSEFSYHCYSQCNVDANLQGVAARGVQYQIKTSHLEHIGHTYKDLHRDLKLANVSSWAQYTLAGIDPAVDLGGQYFVVDISNQANPIVTMQRRSKLLRQYMKFIKRGSVRIEATSTNSILDPVAFIGSDGKYVVVVKASSGSSISVANLPVGIFGIKYTTDQNCGGTTALAYDVDLPDVTLAAGQVLNTNIPACGVITVYQKSSAVPVPTATPVPGATATATPPPVATATPLPVSLSLQPDAVLGIDTFVQENAADVGQHTATTIQVDSTIGARKYGLLYFDLTSIPTGSTITSAALVLNSAATVTNAIPFSVHSMLPSMLPSVFWVEPARWNFAQPNMRWAGDIGLDGGIDAGGSVPGVDYYAVPLGSTIFAANAQVGLAITVALDPTQLGTWITGGNYGLTLRSSSGGMFSVYSSDYPNPAKRPKLNVTYIAALP